MADRLTEDIIDQIWAEAVQAYRAGEKWFLTDEAETAARAVQEEHTEESAKAGMIREFVERKVPADWEDRTLEERLVYWDGDFEEPDESRLVDRTKICAVEVWCELLHGDLKQFTQVQAREINAVLNRLSGWQKVRGLSYKQSYGRQRGFIRKTV